MEVSPLHQRLIEIELYNQRARTAFKLAMDAYIYGRVKPVIDALNVAKEAADQFDPDGKFVIEHIDRLNFIPREVTLPRYPSGRIDFRLFVRRLMERLIDRNLSDYDKYRPAILLVNCSPKKPLGSFLLLLDHESASAEQTLRAAEPLESLLFFSLHSPSASNCGPSILGERRRALRQSSILLSSANLDIPSFRRLGTKWMTDESGKKIVTKPIDLGIEMAFAFFRQDVLGEYKKARLEEITGRTEGSDQDVLSHDELEKLGDTKAPNALEYLISAESSLTRQREFFNLLNALTPREHQFLETVRTFLEENPDASPKQSFNKAASQLGITPLHKRQIICRIKKSKKT
jgi:hypothetical protein